MKCASCGKESNYAVCGRCLAEKYEIVSVPPVVEIAHCSRCGDFRLERWRAVSLEDAVRYHLFRELRLHDELQVDDVQFEPVGDEIGRYRLLVEGMLRDFPYACKGSFEVRLKKIACEKCSRQAGGYYESILQIRADRRDLRDDEIRKIFEIVENALLKERSNPKAFISKIETRKEGIDIYLGDKNLGQKLSRIISRETGAEIRESNKIAGRADGRDFYRFTYLIRLPGFFRGDVVLEGDVVAVVRDVPRKKGYDVRTGRPVRLRNPSVIARRDELKESSVLNVDEATIEILDPFTFETAVVERPEMKVEVGDTVYVLRHNDRLIAIHPMLIE